METIAPAASRGNPDTEQAENTMGIIVGCQRVRGTWANVMAMARNGYAVIRDGNDVRLMWSEAFETEVES